MPIGKVKPSGETEIKLMLGAMTERPVVCLIPARLAEITAEPAFTPWTMPLAVTLATAGADELQLTWPLMSRLLPSL